MTEQAIAVAESPRSVVDYASSYHALGWSIIPLKPGSKKPDLRQWESYQSEPPTEIEVQRWFRGSNRGVAVVLGPVSGNLTCRDFDDLASYERWASAYPHLAASLPTVETPRGRHVYFRMDCGADTQQERRNIIDLGDGELRLNACYCVLPPSIHPTGQRYRWRGQEPTIIPVVPLAESGLGRCHTDTTDNLAQSDIAEHLDSSENLAHSGDCRFLQDSQEHSGNAAQVGSSANPANAVSFSRIHDVRDVQERVESAIQRTLPQRGGERHAHVFKFVRELKAIPELAEAPFMEFKPWVRCWHQAALPVITTKAFDETWLDFIEAWRHVKFPAGFGLSELWQQALEQPLPAAAQEYEQVALQHLVALCRLLQQRWGELPFFLSCQTAGNLVGKDPKTVWRWFRLLEAEGILRLVTKGSEKKRQASSYRYLLE